MASPLNRVQSTAFLGPGTPGLTLVGTPLANAPSTSSTMPSNVKLYNNENTFIYQETLKFESELQKLTESIQHYQPNPDAASNLVNIVDNLNNELNQLELLHDLKSNQMLKQSIENTQLNENLRGILVTLNECRKELNDLPKLPIEEEVRLSQADPSKLAEDDQPKSNQANMKDMKQLLSYAMKLSKFSKIPRTFDGFLMPNNFVWPGDDNMRRGVLAMASMMPDKIIANENGADEESETISKSDKVDEDVDMKDDEEDSDDDLFIDSEMSKTHSAPIPRQQIPAAVPEKKDHASIMADLDLFDDSDDDMA
ncbi:unnamed protein product [Ambrosiozyma monospora]|uniref:Mediator of RNA polymerase II transcription subunit 4 n=1 Tax=Ambrosiozyma monospora TaxID=43982 RepID=A0A9W7DE59_AMBMO|nr:unnamed protein product [Ambrosiozyma monospora]